MSKVLQTIYAQLCQELGDLNYKKSQIESRIQTLELELKGLNFANDLMDQQKREDEKKDE